MKARGGIFKLVNGPMKVGARGDHDVDNDDIIDKMNKIDADRDSDSDNQASENNEEDMGELDMDDGIVMEDDGEEAKN